MRFITECSFDIKPHDNLVKNESEVVVGSQSTVVFFDYYGCISSSNTLNFFKTFEYQELIAKLIE